MGPAIVTNNPATVDGKDHRQVLKSYVMEDTIVGALQE